MFDIAAKRHIGDSAGMKNAHSSLAIFAVLLAGCTVDEPQALAPTSSESGAGTATAILNAGVAAEIGEQGGAVKILFDPLYDDHFGSLEELKTPLIESIVNGAPPYDNVAAVFVSHAHGDHFSEQHLTQMLAVQKDLRLIAPEQAIERLRESDNWDESFAARVTGIALENGAQSASFEVAGATVEAFRSPHSGWPDRHAGVHNITFRVSTPSEAGFVQRVMHLGDADPGLEYFVPHAEFLAAKRSSLAIVPFWYLQADQAEGLFDSTLNAQAAVGMHVPSIEPQGLAESGWDYFTDVGQTVPIPDIAQE